MIKMQISPQVIAILDGFRVSVYSDIVFKYLCLLAGLKGLSTLLDPAVLLNPKFPMQNFPWRICGLPKELSRVPADLLALRDTILCNMLK